MGMFELDNGLEVSVLGTSSGQKKFSEQEIMAAVIAVEDILGMVGFSLGEAIVEEDADRRHVFQLFDNKGEYAGGIWYESFATLLDVVDRVVGPSDAPQVSGLMDWTMGEVSANGDYLDGVVREQRKAMVEKALVLIENRTYIRDLFRSIDADTREALKNRYYGTGFEKAAMFMSLMNDGPEEHYLRCDYDGFLDFDALGYLADKSIAIKIMDTQSAYEVIEYNGQLCEVYVDNGDINDFAGEIKNGTLLNYDGDVVCAFNSYEELIDAQKGMILDDFRDVGLYDDEGNWNFYLTEKELVHIGLRAELDKEKEEAQVYLNDILSNAKTRADVSPAHENGTEIEIG